MTDDFEQNARDLRALLNEFLDDPEYYPRMLGEIEKAKREGDEQSAEILTRILVAMGHEVPS